MPFEQPMRYEIVWKHSDPDYMDPSTGRLPKGPIQIRLDNDQALPVVKDFLEQNWSAACHDPVGALKHPFFVPGGVYTNLWLNDSFFLSMAVPDDGLPWAKGSILNLLDGVLESGQPPKNTSVDGQYGYGYPGPMFAQFAFIVARRVGDFSWLDPYWSTLESIRRWYETETTDGRGFFISLDCHGCVMDNNPSVYGRPPGTSAGVDLASWHFRECKAMEQLSHILNVGRAQTYREKADELKQRVQTRFWDPVDGFFYNIDCCIDDHLHGAQKITWVVHLKFRSFASFFPLWAHLARPEQASAAIERMMSPHEFMSPCGIRSHSAVEPIYNNVAMGGPSNTQGPVWGFSTFLSAYALARYGYKEQALDVCYRLIRTFAADIEQNGCLHESYHGDTGQPMMKPGYMSWNALALKVVDDIECGTDCTTLDLLDPAH